MEFNDVTIYINGSKGLGNYGGFETITKKIVMNEKIHNNFVVSVESDTFISDEAKGVNYQYYPLMFLRKISYNGWNIISESLLLRRYTRKKGKNVIYQFASTPGLFMSRRMKKNVILNPDGVEYNRKKFGKLGRLYLYLSTKKAFKKVDAVCLDSKTLSNPFKEFIKPNQNIYYLSSGADVITNEDVDKSILKKYNVNEKEYYIIVARFVPENNVLEMITYFLNSTSDKTLIVVSDKPDTEYYQKTVEFVKEKKNIIMTGPIYDDVILSTLRYFSFCYLHGHSVGGTNPSLLEAMACKNSVIAHSCGYNVETTNNKALYFDDEESFLKSIQLLEEDETKQEQVSNSMLAIIEDTFTWDYISEKHKVIALHFLATKNKELRDEYIAYIKKSKYYQKYVEEYLDQFDRNYYFGGN